VSSNTAQAGVQNLPSTSTDPHDTTPLAILGLALMASGGALLRWKPAVRIS
jgi:hypothetical protein